MGLSSSVSSLSSGQPSGLWIPLWIVFVVVNDIEMMYYHIRLVNAEGGDALTGHATDGGLLN